MRKLKDFIRSILIALKISKIIGIGRLERNFLSEMSARVISVVNLRMSTIDGSIKIKAQVKKYIHLCAKHTDIV
jgi:hypothetical protein